MQAGDVNIDQLKEDVTVAANALNGNPIYHLSLGSRELFHSNFLAWMIEKFPAAGQEIFGIDGNNLTVEREKYNLDLAITYEKDGKKHVLVVEVKVKDTPRRDQLAEYDGSIEEHFKGHEKRKLLLSLDTLRDEEPSSTVWTYMSFDDLSTKVHDFLSTPHLDMDLSAKSMIQLYASLSKDLQHVFDISIKADRLVRTFFWLDPSSEEDGKYFDQALEKIRFQDTRKKHWAINLRLALEQACREIKGEIEGKGLFFNSGYGLDNKTPHAGVSVYRNIAEEGESQNNIDLGIHIQGNQYRRMIHYGKFTFTRTDAKSIPNFIAETDAWEWLFSGRHTGGNFVRELNAPSFGGYFEKRSELKTAQQKGKLICSYTPRAMYQYTNIGREGGLEIEHVINAAVADLKYAVKLLCDDNYVERYRSWPRR